MLQQMKKTYCENNAHVKEFIDIHSLVLTGEDGTGGYYHIENLCI